MQDAVYEAMHFHRTIQVAEQNNLVRKDFSHDFCYLASWASIINNSTFLKLELGCYNNAV